MNKICSGFETYYNASFTATYAVCVVFYPDTDLIKLDKNPRNENFKPLYVGWLLFELILAYLEFY